MRLKRHLDAEEHDLSGKVCRRPVLQAPWRALPELLAQDQRNLVAWIIPKDALSSCFSTPGIT